MKLHRESSENKMFTIKGVLYPTAPALKAPSSRPKVYTSA